MSSQIEQIRAEIERLVKHNAEHPKDEITADVYEYALQDVLEILDKYEQTHPIPSDVQEAADLYAREWHDNKREMFPEPAKRGFIAGAEWQAVKDGECHEESFEEGAKWQREQMEKKISLIQKSWYDEGKIAGKYEGLTDDEKYQQGAFDERERLMKEIQKSTLEDGYIARDERGHLIYSNRKLERDWDPERSDGYWYPDDDIEGFDGMFSLPDKWFPEVRWADTPKKVKLIILK